MFCLLKKGGNGPLFLLFGLHVQGVRRWGGLIGFCLNKLANEHRWRDSSGSRSVSAGAAGVPKDLAETPGRGKNKSVCQRGVTTPN